MTPLDIFGSLILILLAIACLGLAYIDLQLQRNEQVYRIRMQWIDNNDPRHEQYTYEEMFTASWKTWWGMRWPKDELYKIKNESKLHKT
jgi:hypothetical protein